jgi:sulfite exporter TauE/SafE
MNGTVYAALLLAGLAGSLHCLGMCGPIVAAFAGAFGDADRKEGRHSSLVKDFACYHAGRIWTYGMLGLGVGFAGAGLRSLDLPGWQRGASIVFAVTVILSGLAVGGLLPAPRLDRVLGACGIGRWGGRSWFAALVRTPDAIARLLLGALMGLLPCGLVYAALLLAATLPGPAQAAGGMLLFGAGTVPALSAALLAGRVAPRAFRRHATRAVGIALIAVGCLMLFRAVTVTPEAGCPGCSTPPASVASRSAGHLTQP